MNLATITTFLAIADTGQLNRAASQLHVTQSTITARLNNLESELGQTLFHRRKSGAELTSAGFRFQRYAQLIKDTWRQAQQEAALPPKIDTTFNLGCHFDLWPALGEQIFELLQDDHPEVAISAWCGEQTDLERWLGNGLIDAALGYSPSVQENRTEYRLCPDRLQLVSTQLRQKTRSDPGYLYVDSGEVFRKSHAASFPDGDIPTVTLGSAVWARDYLLQKGGSGYLPLRLIRQDLQQKILHRVADAPEFDRNIYLVVNDDAAVNWPWLEALLTVHMTDR